jgi:hypothetical protein
MYESVYNLVNSFVRPFVPWSVFPLYTRPVRQLELASFFFLLLVCYLATRRWGTRRVFLLALGDALVDPTGALGHAIDISDGRTVQTTMLLRCSSAAEAAAGATGRHSRRFRRFGRVHCGSRRFRGSGWRGHAHIVPGTAGNYHL